MANIVLDEFEKKLLSCCYIYLVAVMVTIRQGFSTVTNAFTSTNDHWPVITLSAEFVNVKHELLSSLHFVTWIW